MILSKIQSSFGKASEKVSKVFNRLSLSGGWAKLLTGCKFFIGVRESLHLFGSFVPKAFGRSWVGGCGFVPKRIGMPMCGWLKLFFKLCGGKCFAFTNTIENKTVCE